MSYGSKVFFLSTEYRRGWTPRWSRLVTAFLSLSLIPTELQPVQPGRRLPPVRWLSGVPISSGPACAQTTPRWPSLTDLKSKRHLDLEPSSVIVKFKLMLILCILFLSQNLKGMQRLSGAYTCRSRVIAHPRRSCPYRVRNAPTHTGLTSVTPGELWLLDLSTLQ